MYPVIDYTAERERQAAPPPARAPGRPRGATRLRRPRRSLATNNRSFGAGAHLLTGAQSIQTS